MAFFWNINIGNSPADLGSESIGATKDSVERCSVVADTRRETLMGARATEKISGHTERFGFSIRVLYGIDLDGII
jgi:hypothetical protein